MKRNRITLVTGLIIACIFVLVLVAFQVRQTELAVVTTFGRYSRTINEPGLKWRLPYPIQEVYRFDRRIHNFERKFEQTSTRDARNLMITVFVGWRIADPHIFLERFQGGKVSLAEQNLENLIRDTKNGVIGRHPFSDLISTNAKELKFDQIEQEMLAEIQPKARENYGIEVVMIGIQRLGLPESITSKVFERMREERMRLVKKLSGEGQARAIQIRAEADEMRQQLLAEAEAQATRIRGEADGRAAESFRAFERNPELAVFLLQLKAFEVALEKRATLILDEQTAPFNLLRGLPEMSKINYPAAEPTQLPELQSNPTFVPASSGEPLTDGASIELSPSSEAVKEDTLPLVP